MSDLLLEIGCENLPPASIRPAFEQLRRDTAEHLRDVRLPFGEIYATGTPRRIVLIVRGLADKQTDRVETITGPPVSKAVDDQGKPTQAASGFARSHGIAVGNLKKIPTERGEYLGFTRRLKSERASVLLKGLIPSMISGIRFPKTMRWEDGDVRFARPIRWIVCLLGEKLIRFEIAGVKSGRTTYTIPWIRREGLVAKTTDQYLEALRRARVVLDHEARYKVIVDLARKTARRDKLTLVEDTALFDELTFMLEEPVPLVGDFDRKYLTLPEAVVITAMKAHQRYLAFRDGRGGLVAKFLAFTEGKVGSPSVVRHGNEKVLRARLEDAFFYYEEDLKTGVDGLASKLASIVFIEGLGSLEDKTGRMYRLAASVNAALPARDRVADKALRRGTRLAKADLASEMIKDGKEFTLLQGLIGSCYAVRAKEPGELVEAIREHYLPRFPGDDLPSTRLGTLLALSDRIDTIVGCFLAGLVPTGSQDPYALRRQANGLLRILESKPWVEIDTLLEQAITAYVDGGLADAAAGAEVMARLVDFFESRMASFLKESGVAYDVVAAVSAVTWAAPAVALNRARAFESTRGDASFELLITGVKRVSNIIDDEKKVFGAGWPATKAAFLGSGALAETMCFDRTKFVDAAETSLLTAIEDAIPKLMRYEQESNDRAILHSLSALGPVIDAYFDQVLINCPDPALRANRHQFLAAVFALFSKYADFSRIVEEGRVSVG
ncbi:MAG: glycine--tRNA ligase subunit beta [Candidatus Krumholzibacteria bacterium]|nr:glycine--tRNA ligase subunit beta [Candidatus Krumholzibacteria bacterium]